MRTHPLHPSADAAGQARAPIFQQRRVMLSSLWHYLDSSSGFVSSLIPRFGCIFRFFIYFFFFFWLHPSAELQLIRKRCEAATIFALYAKIFLM